MKKTISLTLILFMYFSLVSTAFAADIKNLPYDSTLPRVIDKADILTESEEKRLNELIENIVTDYSFDLVILTVNSIGNKTVQDFADDYYDYNHYGYGESSDGILFMLNMSERDYYSSTTGKGIDVFTDYSLDFLHNEVVSHLSSGDYFYAFERYIILIGEILESEKTSGIIYDNDNPFDDNFIESIPKANTGYFPDTEYILIALLVGFFIAFVAVSNMKGKMKTAVFKNSARDYVIPGTFVLTKEADRFLFRTTTRVKIENDTSNTGGKAGGGSSVHTGSSGTSHGGGGGKF